MVPGDEFTHDGWRYAPRPAPFDWQQIPEVHQQRRGPTAAGLFGLFLIVCALTIVLLLIAGTR